MIIDDLWRDLDRLARMGATPRELALDAGVWTVFNYRLARALHGLPGPLSAPLRALHRPFDALLKLATGVKLSPEADIGGGLYVARASKIVVNPGAHLGRDCNLYAGVRIEATPAGPPWLGDRVYVGPGAHVFGPVRVGNDAAVGSGAVVVADVPDGCAAGAQLVELRRNPAVRGRKRPPLFDQLRGALRSWLPPPAQLLLRAG